jgi:DUF1680 family protein
VELFSLDDVRLLPGPFADAAESDLRYVLALDADRLLAPFFTEAGLEPKAPAYGNWESDAIAGHSAGHYLSALAILTASLGSVETRTRLDRMVNELGRVQDAVGTGYVGGVPGGAALFEALRFGGVDAARELGSSDHWVPWYNVHKTFRGLIDAYRIGGVERALTVVVRLADWWLDIAADIDDGAFEVMLDTEHGAMNDVFADLAVITGRGDYAAMARRFTHHALFDPLVAGRDALTGQHANTQIPQVHGFATTAAVSDPGEAFHAAADAFWRAVVTRRSVAIGGNSVREHFHDTADFTSMIDDREGPEFCNTYNMLKLTYALNRLEARPEYLDYAERAIFNHLLSAQRPGGGFVYFTPMRPRHYRVYSQPGLGFWCCVGTGMEAQARYGEWIFAKDADAVAVNLPIAATLRLPGGGSLRLDTDFPRTDTLTLTFDLAEARTFPVRLRVPAWCDDLVDLAVNGQPVNADRRVRAAVYVDREWKAGDVLTYRLPITLRTERLPDGSPWQAYLAGPIVLASRDGGWRLDGLLANDTRWGHVAHGPLQPLGDLPLTGDGVTGVERRDDVHYRVHPVDGPPFDLEPFAGLHDSRYTIDGPIAGNAVSERRAELTRLDAGAAVDALTIDRVAFGEQQPEADHGLRATQTETGSSGAQLWRTTRDRMGVTLRNTDAAGSGLRVGLRLLPEPTAVEIRLDGHLLTTETFGAGTESLELAFPVGQLLADAGHPATFELEFASVDGRPTPGVAMVRLLRWKA